MEPLFTRCLLFLCILTAGHYTLRAQSAARIYVEPDGWSIGGNIGQSDLWADVGTKSPIEHYTNSKYFDKVPFIGGMFARYTVHPCFAIRLAANYGSLYASDKWNYDKGKNSANQGTDAYQRLARDQSAKDVIFESTLLFEFTPRRINPEGRGAYKRGQPYLAAGFTYFHYEPFNIAGASATWVKTYNLDLEGQGFGAGYPPKKSLWQPAVPLAIGYRWDLGLHVNFGIEYMYRITFTDYLDGVSGKYIDNAAYVQHLAPRDAVGAESIADKGHYTGLEQPNAPGNLRGNAGNKDAYSTISFVLYYKINSHTRTWWR